MIKLIFQALIQFQNKMRVSGLSYFDSLFWNKTNEKQIRIDNTSQWCSETPFFIFKVKFVVMSKLCNLVLVNRENEIHSKPSLDEIHLKQIRLLPAVYQNLERVSAYCIKSSVHVICELNSILARDYLICSKDRQDSSWS